MKEIKEEIKREVVDTHIYYEASDGTRFTVDEECRKYEHTALCVAKSKLKPLIATEEHSAWDIMGGYEDNSILGLKLSTSEEAENVKHWLLLNCPYLDRSEYKERKEKLFAEIDSAIGDLLIIGINCNDEWYVINSRKNIISNLNNLDKKDNA